MPPITLLRARDDAAKFGLEPDKLLELKEKAMGARGRAYCMSFSCSYSCSFHLISI